MVERRIVLTRLAAFAATVIVVVAGATAAPLFDEPQTDRMEHPEYDVVELVPEVPAADGQTGVVPTDDSGVVAIDLTHRNRITAEQIQPLTSAITAAGYGVEFVRDDDEFQAALSRADGFVVIDPDQRYTTAEVDLVESFVEKGGRLVMVGEPERSGLTPSFFGLLLSPFPNRLDSLATRFGFEFSDGYLFNMETNDGNHRDVFARGASGPRLAEGVNRAAVYTAASVTSQDGRPVLLATAGTRNSRTDATGEYAVAAVDGGVLAIGDRTFLERGNYRVLDNEQFLANVVRFLVSGVRTRTLADYPATLGPSPTVRFTTPGLLGAAQLVGDDLRTGGASPSLELRRGAIGENGTNVLITTFDYLEEHDLTTGVIVDRGRVKVGSYESNQTGVVVVRAPPRSAIGLVIVADTPRRAERGAELVVDRELGQYLISDSTAVFRSGAAVPERFEDGNGTDNSSSG